MIEQRHGSPLRLEVCGMYRWVIVGVACPSSASIVFKSTCAFYSVHLVNVDFGPA
jgi:hypothetical protein